MIKCQLHHDNNCNVRFDGLTEDGSSAYYCPVNKSYFLIIPWKVKLTHFINRLKTKVNIL
jgi:hypothetical protein